MSIIKTKGNKKKMSSLGLIVYGFALFLFWICSKPGPWLWDPRKGKNVMEVLFLGSFMGGVEGKKQ